MTAQPVEFSRTVRIETIGAEPRVIEMKADETERVALARRFALPAIASLAAELSLTRNGSVVNAEGRLRAQVTQSCVASGVPVEASIDEPFRLRFSPPPEPVRGADEEVELSEEDCDTIFYEGTSIDIGEAVAETLSLSLDPWPRAPGAEEALMEAGIKSEEDVAPVQRPSPFAALAALKAKPE